MAEPTLIYVVGPIRDIAALNVFQFLDVQAKLRLLHRNAGVRIPHDICGNDDAIEYVKKCQAAVSTKHEELDHDGFCLSLSFILANRPILVVLPGWEGSVGTRTELAAAVRLGLRIWFWDESTPSSLAAKPPVSFELWRQAVLGKTPVGTATAARWMPAALLERAERVFSDVADGRIVFDDHNKYPFTEHEASSLAKWLLWRKEAVDGQV